MASAGLVLLLGAALCLSQATKLRTSRTKTSSRSLRRTSKRPAATSMQSSPPWRFRSSRPRWPSILKMWMRRQTWAFCCSFRARQPIPFPTFAPRSRRAMKQPTRTARRFRACWEWPRAAPLDFADARKDMEAAFPRCSQRPRFQVQLGLELVGLDTESGDLEKAAAVLAQLRKADPDNPEVLYAAYRTYSDLSGESMLALSLAAPDSAQMHQLLAHEETRQGNTNGAIAQYRKAIAIDPHLPGVHFELAELLHTSRTRP